MMELENKENVNAVPKQWNPNDVNTAAVCQLSATNQQDDYLTKNPDITFFKSKPKRHSTFSIANLESSNFTQYSGGFQHEFSRKGDLLAKVSLVWEFAIPKKEVKREMVHKPTIIEEDSSFAMVHNVTKEDIQEQEEEREEELLPSLPAKVTSVFHLFEEVEFVVGNAVVSRLNPSECKFIMATTNNMRDSKRTYVNLGFPDDKIQLKIDLPFWFAQDYSQSVPLVALNYHNVFLKVKTKYKPTKVRYDAIYLDTQERSLFVKAPRHDYMVNQMTTRKVENDGSIVGCVNPIRYFFFKLSDIVGDRVVLKINGAPRFFCDKNQVKYDNFYQSNLLPDHMHGLLSFCINAKDSVNPSGSLNFSRIDSVSIEGLKPGSSITFNSWNIFGIVGGMGQLKYVY